MFQTSNNAHTLLGRWLLRIKQHLQMFARRTLSVSTRRRIVRYTRWPPVGWVRFGNFRRVTPISRHWGEDRGLPIDRYYIERFLAKHTQDIRGRVLEIANNTYTLRFGGDRVTQSDILHAAEGDPKATLVADLACADHIPSDTFDCIICTQTIQVIPDVGAAVRTLHRILKPGGVLLATVPSISKIYRDAVQPWGDHWHFTTLSAQWLFEKGFAAEHVRVEAHGNVLAATAFLHGLAAEELQQEELDYHDLDYHVSISIRAVKPQALR